MTTPALRLALFLLPIALIPSVLPAQGSAAWSGCRADSLSIYNCAQYYSGTVSLASELKTANGTETSSVIATVTGGRVTCRVKGPETPEFEAPGMLAVEHGSNMNSGAFKIQVWCPEAAGERVTRHDAPSIETYDQRAPDYTTLDGRDAHEHPNTDAANGVTGTEVIIWRLRRSN
jgi:hypothetical protein